MKEIMVALYVFHCYFVFGQNISEKVIEDKKVVEIVKVKMIDKDFFILRKSFIKELEPDKAYIDQSNYNMFLLKVDSAYKNLIFNFFKFDHSIDRVFDFYSGENSIEFLLTLGNYRRKISPYPMNGKLVSIFKKDLSSKLKEFYIEGEPFQLIQIENKKYILRVLDNEYAAHPLIGSKMNLLVLDKLNNILYEKDLFEVSSGGYSKGYIHDFNFSNHGLVNVYTKYSLVGNGNRLFSNSDVFYTYFFARRNLQGDLIEEIELDIKKDSYLIDCSIFSNKLLYTTITIPPGSKSFESGGSFYLNIYDYKNKSTLKTFLCNEKDCDSFVGQKILEYAGEYILIVNTGFLIKVFKVRSNGDIEYEKEIKKSLTQYTSFDALVYYNKLIIATTYKETFPKTASLSDGFAFYELYLN